jgi:hypothetical protein
MFESILHFFDMTFWQKVYYLGVIGGVGTFIWLAMSGKEYLKGWIDK